MSEQGHGGRAVSAALGALGVDHLFTLTGGHIFPILDGCHQDGIQIVDVRHEQTAGFAAEGWARLTRTLGVAAVTAGPGVTNALSALAQAAFNRAPVLTLAGRAPTFRWGQGSLQEIDHIPFVEPIAEARTVGDTSAITKEIAAAAERALAPPRGPQFLDFPLDVLFDHAAIAVEPPPGVVDAPADAGEVESIARLVADSARPVAIAGSNVWLDGAERDLRAFAERTGVPIFMNGQGRGCLPADHPLAFARARSKALREADLVVVFGTPLDFRLGFGQSFGPETKVVHVDAGGVAAHVPLAASMNATTRAALAGLTAASDPMERSDWVGTLRAEEEARAGAAAADLTADSSPIHPMRIYGELARVLERDAVVICDGGDFASYAGREVPVYEPGGWLDPGPYGCLGCGFGYALAASRAFPGRRIVLLLGDGALGFAGMEMETLTRLGLPVVAIVGNNGIWGLEKHPMRNLYGYDVAAELQPGLRYDDVMRALGGHGELVVDPAEIGPALERAFAAEAPALVNVITDPDVAYPRSANLA